MSANKTAPVTLRTLADQLGLHVSTVSRVLHAGPEASHRAASSETFARVRKLADELGYRPNPHATSLRTRRSNLVGEHLLALGHRDAGVVAGEPYASTGVDRSAGFLAAYAEAGIEIPGHRITNSGHDARGGHVATEKLLAAGPPPSALFAVNDFAAIGAFGALRDHGLRVGEDIAVAGFNDTPLAAELPVPLTTVRSPMREMGRRGLALLAGMMREEQAQSQRLRPQLVVRASTTGTR
ncbi:substrate-binding domain-containing protein [Saccharomonospora sp. NPDC006951]